MAKYNSDPTLRYRDSRENRGDTAVEKHSSVLSVPGVKYSEVVRPSPGVLTAI